MTSIGERPGARGFTVVEVLITVVVAGVIGGTLMSLVVGQHRFYAQSDNLLLAQQNLRASMDLMASELRMASPGDIETAAADSIAVRFDLVRGVVCEGASGDANVFVYDSVGTANLTGGITGIAWSGPYDSAFVYDDGFTGSVTGSHPASETACKANGAPATEPSASFRLVSGWPATATPPRGSVVRWYGTLTYSFAPSVTDPGSEAIWRNNQELATPFETGARFEYVMDDGSVQSSVSGSSLADIREIRIGATAIGQGPFQATRDVVYDIPLRN